MRKVVTKYPVSEAAKQIGVSVSTVRSLIEKGELDKTQDNPVMVSRVSVIRYQARTNKFEEIEGKVKIVHTYLGQVRKILKYDAYMASDISSLLGLASNMCKAMKADELIKYEECKEYGLTPNIKGYALVTLNTLKSYLKTSRADIDKSRLLAELMTENIKIELPNVEDKHDVNLTNEEQQEPTKQELAEYQNMMMFNGNSVEVIVVDGNPMFELYSTGMALGHAKWNGRRTSCTPAKDRIDKNVKSAEISTVVHNGQQYITEEQLYDLMLEMKTDKVKPFRKWVTSEVLPTIRKTGGYVAPKQEERFINNYFTNLPQATKELLISDLEAKNSELIAVRDNHYKEYMKVDEEIEANEEFIKKLKE